MDVKSCIRYCGSTQGEGWIAHRTVNGGSIELFAPEVLKVNPPEDRDNRKEAFCEGSICFCGDYTLCRLGLLGGRARKDVAGT